MILVLLTILLLVIGLLIYFVVPFKFKWIKGNWENTPKFLGLTQFFSLIIGFSFLIGISITLCSSYESYLNLRSFYTATIEQYRGQITLYKDYAKLDMSSYTDFRGAGYQQEISKKISTLSEEIIKYNGTIVKKRILKKNIIFSWLIIEPDDDMIIIRLIEKQNKEKK
jgi:heme/copper-type cytochrome/quinol oxidase subunit 2